jgi:4-amino-4-deoxy-L-arabinose transferase-like glycosyltransferase
MSRKNIWLSAWILALVIKTVLAVWLPFSNDEAYYWVWGHHLQWSYFDHPPMVGWLFWLGSWFETFGNAARLPGVWMGHLTLFIWYKILEPFLNEKTRLIWFLFILLSPFMGIGSLVITPDVPLLFFWSLSLLLLLKLLEKKTASLYLLFGASLGLGFCSKYMIVLFVPIAFLWLLGSGRWREIRWPYVALTILTGLIFSAPVLYWNWKHEWASFAFQLNHGLGREKRQMSWPIEYVGGQILLIFPPLIWLALRRRESKAASFLRYFGWLPLAFFLYTSFRARVEANWPIMAHPALLSLAFLNCIERGESSGPFKWLQSTAIIWTTALVLVLTELAYPWLPIDPKDLKTSEFSRFDVFLPQATRDPQMFMGSYQMAAAVSYKLRQQHYKLAGMNRRDFYDFVPQSMPIGDSFLLGAETNQGLPEWVEKNGFETRVVQRLTDEFQILEVSRHAKDIDH